MVDGPLTDAEVWACVEHTLRQVILPALPADQEWARAATVQLVGLVRYAATRPPGGDVAERRRAELVEALGAVEGNPLVPAGGEPADRVAAALVAAVGDTGEDAQQIRAVLRPVVVAHLDEEVAVTGPLVDAFRGRLDES